MKAIANFGRSIPKGDEQLILDALNTVMDIKIVDLDTENGVLFLRYQNRLALDLAEKKLSKIGHPIISYSYPERSPLKFNGGDPEDSGLV